jgi:hypothetical protein
MSRLYGDAADVMERAGDPPVTEIMRLADADLTKHDHLLHQKIGRALRSDVSNSKERTGHPDEILLQAAAKADNGSGGDDGNVGGDDGGGGDSTGGGGGDGGGDDDVLPSATVLPSSTMLPSSTNAGSLTNIRVANTTAVAMRRLLTEVSNWAEMKTACGSSGTVALSDDFVMGTEYTPTPSPLYGGIDFSGKQLVIIGNSKTLDAGGNG